MLAIARGLMSRPKILMLDEPSLGLSPILVRTMFELIGTLNEQNVTILLIEQNIHQALKIADQAYVMKTGKIVMQGPGKELLCNEKFKTLTSESAGEKNHVSLSYSVELILQLVVNGILFGAMYGIAAIGMSLIFGTMRIFFPGPGNHHHFFCLYLFLVVFAMGHRSLSVADHHYSPVIGVWGSVLPTAVQGSRGQ